MACSGVSQVPVAVDTMGIRGGESRTVDTTSAKAETAGSIIAEWNACEVCSGRVITCRASSCFWSAATASAGPATTQSDGPLMEATETSAGSSRATSAAGRRTDSIVPGGMLCINRPRRATSFRASSSEKTPAMQAATNSPTL